MKWLSKIPSAAVLAAAIWRMPYAGSRSRGSLEFAAHKVDGTWKLSSAQLEVDGEVIDLRRCSKEAR